MPRQERASFRSNPNIVQVLDLKQVNPRAWQNNQQRFIGPTLPSNISFMPSKNKTQDQRHESKPPMLLTLEQEHQPIEEGEELLPGFMALGGGRRSGATPPIQRREGAPRIEIKTGGFWARRGRSREEEERGRKKRAPPPLYSPRGTG